MTLKRISRFVGVLVASALIATALMVLGDLSGMNLLALAE
jgi:hypothetical protein